MLLDLWIGDLLAFAVHQLEPGMIMQGMTGLNMLEGVLRCPPTTQNGFGLLCIQDRGGGIGKPGGTAVTGVIPDDETTQGESV